MRESKDNPRLKAFCRVAPSVLFNARAIFPAGVFFRASAFNVRTCSDVHARRFPFLLAIISPSGQNPALSPHDTQKKKKKQTRGEARASSARDQAASINPG